MNFQHLKVNFSGKRGRGGAFRRAPAMPMRACAGVELGPAGPVCARARRDWRGRLHFENLPAAAVGVADRRLPASGCLAVNDSLTVWLDAPFEAWSKTRRVLPALLDAQLPFALEDCRYSFAAARRVADGKTQVLALAARVKVVETQLERYRAAGWDPVFLDHAGLALWTQSLLEIPALPDEARVLMYLQPDRLTVVTGRGGDFQQAHALAWEAETSGADGERMEALFSRLERILYAQAGADWRPHWLLYAGAGVSALLSDELARRLPQRWPGRLSRPADAAGILSRALAGRALMPGAWRCNLRDGPLLHPAVRGWRRQAARRTAVMALAAGCLLLAGNAIWQLSASHRLQSMRGAVSALAARLAPGERIPYGREAEEAQRAWESEQQSTAGLHAALAAELHLRIGQLLEAGAADGIAYQVLEADDRQFTIRCAAADWGRFEALARRLRELGYAAAPETLPALEDGRAACVINGKWRE